MVLKLVPLSILLLAAASVSAADVYRDYAVTVTMEATESSRNGQDWAKTTRKHRYEFTTRLHSNGELSDYNPKDPAEIQRSTALAGAVQRKVQAAQARRPAPAAPARSLEELGAEMQKAQAACAGNQPCLMALAMKMSTPEMQQQMQAAQTGAAARQCAQVRDPAQRQACRQATGGAAPAAPPGQDDDALLAEEREARYLQFVGTDKCTARIHVRVDDRTEGAYADVQGMVPYVIEQKADGTGDANLKTLLCVSHSPVLDTKSGILWFDTVGVPVIRGSYIHTERGRTQRNDDSEMTMPSGVAEWINETLRKAPSSGSRSVVLPLFQSTQKVGKVEGQARVSATWSFK